MCIVVKKTEINKIQFVNRKKNCAGDFVWGQKAGDYNIYPKSYPIINLYSSLTQHQPLIY
jgi:hypothetical protein